MDSIISCKLCKLNVKSLRGLSSHLWQSHKELNFKHYYDSFLKKDNEEKCKYCFKETKFISITIGYSDYCSRKCSIIYSNKSRWKDKEWKQKFLEKNKNKLFFTSENISNINKRNWKDENYREKMKKSLSASRKRNWKDENYRRIKSKQNSDNMKNLNKKDWFRDILQNKALLKSSWGISGIFIKENIYFSSTWEAIVIYKYLNKGKSIVRCPKQFTIKYIGNDNKSHLYYPDFYIKEDNTIIEVKSKWQIENNHRNAKIKIQTALNEFSQRNVKFLVMTEDDIFEKKEDKYIFSYLKKNEIIKLNKNSDNG